MNPNEPKFAIKVPRCPGHLVPVARKEFRRVGKLLAARGVLTEIDGTLLATYAAAYARWVAAEQALALVAEKDPICGGLMIKTANGTAIQNPLVGIANRAIESMNRIGQEFGMSPASRTRIQVGHGDAQPTRNPFAAHGRRTA